MVFAFIYMYVCVGVYYSVQLNRSRQWFRQDKKSFNYEHLNFPGKELNVFFLLGIDYINYLSVLEYSTFSI